MIPKGGLRNVTAAKPKVLRLWLFRAAICLGTVNMVIGNVREGLVVMVAGIGCYYGLAWLDASERDLKTRLNAILADVPLASGRALRKEPRELRRRVDDRDRR